MLYEIFVLSKLWSHMMDDSRIIKKSYLRTSQQKCVPNTRWLHWEKKRKEKKLERRQGEWQILRSTICSFLVHKY
jgi:hypothetical protein